jgi:hypothetical protein
MTNPKPDGGERSIILSFYHACKSLGTALPTLLGVVLLLGLFLTLVSKQFIASVFTGELLRDTAIGSIAAGNAVNSYIIGGELMKGGVSLCYSSTLPEGKI